MPLELECIPAMEREVLQRKRSCEGRRPGKMGAIKRTVNTRGKGNNTTLHGYNMNIGSDRKTGVQRDSMFLVRVEHLLVPFLQFRSIHRGASDEDKDYGFHLEHVELLMAVKPLNRNVYLTPGFTNLDFRDKNCAKIWLYHHLHVDCEWSHMSG